MLQQIKVDPEWGFLMLGQEQLRCGTVLRVLVPDEKGGAELRVSRLEMGACGYYLERLRSLDVPGLFAEIAD